MIVTVAFTVLASGARERGEKIPEFGSKDWQTAALGITGGILSVIILSFVMWAFITIMCQYRRLRNFDKYERELRETFGADLDAGGHPTG
jgi:hypothetical protein